MLNASMSPWDYTGPVLAVTVLVTVTIQILLLLLGLKHRRKQDEVESNRWWLGAVSLWTLTFGILSFLGSLWGKHSALSIGPEGVSALSSSAFLYLYDITEAIPRLYASTAVFLLGVSCSLVLRLATRTQPSD